MNLLSSASVFSFFTLISRVLGYLRDILIAIFLGTSIFADAFFVAFRLPNTFRRLFAEGTFNAAFIPSYTSARIENGKKGKKFADEVLNILLLVLIFIVTIVEIFTPHLVYIIAPGFSENSIKFDLAVQFTRITFPFLVFVSLSSFFSAILNSYNKFAAAAAAPIILNVVLILSLIISYFYNFNFAKQLSYGVTLAGILQLFFLIYVTYKFYKPIINFKIKQNKKINIFFKKLLPSVLSSGVTQINILIGTIIASFEAGAVSYLYYADRIYQINLAIAGIAIGTVILPQLSKYIQNDKKNKIILIQNKALELSLFLSIPASIALLIGSEQIVSALFGYGSFGEDGVKSSAKALFYFSLGLPAFSLIKVFSSFFFARHNTKIPFYISLISVLLNILISVIYFKNLGFIIIPIATTISSWFNSIMLFIFLKKKNLFKFNLIFIKRFVRILLASFIMGLFFNYLINFFDYGLSYDQKLKSVYLIGVVLLGLISYFLIAVLIKAFKISDIKLKY
jgi:putative peptidoglycan lipid II flippase